MSEYSKEQNSSYAEPAAPAGNLGPPVASTPWFLAIEADNPSLGLIGDLVHLLPGYEGWITMAVTGGGPVLCVAVTDYTTPLTFPDPCSWIGFNQVDVEVENEYGVVHLGFFIDVQDNMGFCGA